jgi:hypothetical protein
LILGRRGTGKTDFSLLIAEILHKFNIIDLFATNIKIYESPFPIDYITNLQDLEFWCQNNPGRKQFILDEAGKSLRRRTPMSKLNIELLDNLQVLRKYKLSLDMIVPSAKYIDSASLGSDVLDVVFNKPCFDNQKVGVWIDQQEPYRMTYSEIPATQIKFDSFDVAPFIFKSPSSKPIFSDKDQELIYRWAQGEPCKSLGIHNMTLSRILRKFTKEVLERDLHITHL